MGYFEDNPLPTEQEDVDFHLAEYYITAQNVDHGVPLLNVQEAYLDYLGQCSYAEEGYLEIPT